MKIRIYNLRNHFVSLLDILKDIKNKLTKKNLKKTKDKKMFLEKIEGYVEKNLKLSVDWFLTYFLFFIKEIKNPIEHFYYDDNKRPIKKDLKELMKQMLFTIKTTENIKKIILYKMEKEENNDRTRLLKKVEIINKKAKILYRVIEQKNREITKV